MATPWIPSTSVTEQAQAVAPPASIDQACVVFGPTSIGSVGLSPLYQSAASAIAALGYGDTIDAASYITDPINPDRQTPGPVAIYKCASTTPGSYVGSANNTGVTGTGLVSVDSTSPPYGTYQVIVQFGAAFVSGTTGGTWRWALDNGTGNPNWSSYAPIGTQQSLTIPNSNVRVNLGLAVKGTTDATASGLYGSGGSLNGLTLILNVNGGGVLTLNLSGSGNTATQAAFLAAIHAEWSAITATVDASNHLVLTDATGSGIVVGAGTANTALGLTAATYTASFNAGDTVTFNTLAPTFSSTDIDTAATALAQSSYDFSQILFVGVTSATLAAHVTTLLNTLSAAGKKVEATVITRGPNVNETEATWMASVESDFAAFVDDRIEIKEGFPLQMQDPVTSRFYLRSWAPQYFARMLASPDRSVWAGSPNDGPLDGVQLYTSGGTLIGHDEGPSGNASGLGDAIGSGNRIGCVFRGSTPQTRLGVYTTAPWVCFNPATIGSDPVYLAMVRRIVNNAERAALAVSFDDLGGKVFADTDPTTQISTLQADSQEAIHGTMFDSLTIAVKGDVENAGDANATTGLVQVQPVVTISNQLIIVNIVVLLKVGDWIIKIALTVAVG